MVARLVRMVFLFNCDTACMLGHVDVMYEAANKTTYPGWGFMLENGATTIWEVWSLYSFFEKLRSLSKRHGGADSMIMWATIEGFFYNTLAGINAPSYYGPELYRAWL